MKSLWLKIVVVLAAIAPGAAFAERPKSFDEAIKKLDVRFEPAEAKPGETVTLKITVEPVPGFFTYPSVQPDKEFKAIVNRFAFPPAGQVIFVGPMADPPGAKTRIEEELDNARKLYYPEAVTWERKAIVSPKAMPGPISVS